VLPAAVRRRVLRRAAIAAGAPAGRLTAGHVDALERLVVDWRGQGPVNLPGPLIGERRCGRLVLR
jgi:tRNA(Ile)-lysidine synthase